MTRTASASLRRVGRFELQRVLGRGAQASVWLAHDPRLEREVAVKLFAGDADAAFISESLNEARAVSRLTHPNIVPVFEADESQGQPYLVFEYVEGTTLVEVIHSKGARTPRQAVELMLGVLDALAAAHAQGIVHRDLKPSNVLLGRDGRARVMDFGIAARVAAQTDGSIFGTPGYISPEAARGEAPAATMDVFSAGVLIAELMIGRRVMVEANAMRALYRVQREDLMLPADLAVDDQLRGIVQRALAREATKRFDSAASMRDALAQWLAQQQAQAIATAAAHAETASAQGGHGHHGTLDFLLRRMRHKSDFPALGDAVVRIQHAATSETESLGSLTAEVLNDVALTQKLLRMVNSVNFRHAGGGTVATVSRAVALVGFAGVRNLALSLVLLEHMQNKQHAASLKEEFLRALMAGTLAGALAPLARESEEVFIGAMFQNLGRLLTEFYFPEEALQIRQQSSGESHAARDESAARVLGIGFEELGVGVAKSWGLPEALQRCMRAPQGEPPSRVIDKGPERQRWLARCANELTDAMLDDPQSLQKVAQDHARVLGLDARDVLAATEAAKARLAEFAQTMGIELASASAARRLMPPEMIVTVAMPRDAGEPETEAGTGRPDVPIDVPVRAPATDVLTAGIADLTQTLAGDDFKLNDVLRMVLETMYRAIGVQRVVFCLRDARADALVGRLALGSGGDAAARLFKIPLRAPAGAVPDLFAAICLKGADTLIADASRANISSRLPDWYRRTLNAPTFLLLPLSLKGAPIGMIYADAATSGAIAIGEKELTLLRALRNQAVMAFRQLER